MNKDLLVANDAGGANQLMWLAKYELENPSYLLSGPALKISKNLGIKANMLDNQLNIENYSRIIVASSIDMTVPNILIREARAKGIVTVGIVDHWANLGQRWSKEIPDLFWVTDFFAYRIMVRNFGFSNVRIKKNYYLKDIKRDLLNFKPVGEEKITFLATPKNLSAGTSKSCFCSELFALSKLPKINKMILRNHPYTSIQDCVYNTKGKISKDIEVIVSDSNNSLARDLAGSTMVIGYPSYALYISKRIGIKTRSLSALEFWEGPNFRHLKLNIDHFVEHV